MKWISASSKVYIKGDPIVDNKAPKSHNIHKQDFSNQNISWTSKGGKMDNHLLN